MKSLGPRCIQPGSGGNSSYISTAHKCAAAMLRGPSASRLQNAWLWWTTYSARSRQPASLLEIGNRLTTVPGERRCPTAFARWRLFSDSTRQAVEQGLWLTLVDAIAVLELRSIKFALIGGLAVSLRGQPRMTFDVDLVILADIEQALQLARELSDTPFEPLFAGVEQVVSTSFILPVRHR